MSYRFATRLQVTPKWVNNIFKENIVNAIVFKATVDLFNSGNLKVAIAQLCNELQVCNYAIDNPKVGELHLNKIL